MSNTTGITYWLTGLPAAGKTTIAQTLWQHLRHAGKQAVLLDGDSLRKKLCADLGYSEADRDENVRRAGALACLLNEQGMHVVVSLISPFASARQKVRQEHESGKLRFIEVFIDTPLEVCMARDPKGLYARARSGELHELTGFNAPYEAPVAAELTIPTAHYSPEEAALHILNTLR